MQSYINEILIEKNNDKLFYILKNKKIEWLLKDDCLQINFNKEKYYININHE